MKNWLKKITGISKIEEAKAAAEKEHAETLARIEAEKMEPPRAAPIDKEGA